jgi:bifunctional UDP-N-acetylglucosamine pyrophosphorylase / glucosamine-1-phosphate N-acetyltransferase
MLSQTLEIIALAGGKGTRVNSEETGTPKALLLVKEKPLLEYIIESAEELSITPVAVIGFLGNKIEEYFGNRARFVYQDPPMGTGHAVKVALPKIKSNTEQVLIVPGDHGYIYSSKIYKELLETHNSSKNDVTIVAFNVENPYGYGRLVVNEKGQLKSIVEEKNATEEEKKITLINSATLIVRRNILDELVNDIEVNEKSGEYYLTDIVEIANKKGLKVGIAIPKGVAFMDGVNTFEQLAQAQSI